MQRSTTFAAWRHRARGFTLVELLVVMVIIAMLAALITPAVFMALQFARETEHYTELTKLSSAIELYKTEFNNYPPDGTGGQKELNLHIRAAFPSMRGGAAKPPSDLDAAKSLVFWLSEISKDRQNPFKKIVGSGGNESVEDRHQFFSFDQKRLKNGMYYPPGYEPDFDPPYVYFNSKTYANAKYQYRGGSQAGSSTQGQPFKPYQFPKSQSSGQGGGGSSRGGQSSDYAQPDTFQIVSGGLDKKLGTGGTLMSDDGGAGGGGSSYISLDDEDNKVNFDKRRVSDIRRTR